MGRLGPDGWFEFPIRAHDYLDLDSAARSPVEPERDLGDSPEAIQARAREAWAAFRARDQQSGASPEDIQRLARERWQEYRQGQDADRGGAGQDQSGATNAQDRSHGKDDDQSL